MTLFAYEMDEASQDGWGITEYGAVLSDMDDIWTTLDRRPDKFELLDLPLGEITLDDMELEDLFNLALDDNSKIVHHDCMWAGICGDKYHPGNSSSSMSFSSCSSIIPDTPSVPPQAIFNIGTTQPANTNTAGRSLLLTSARTPPAAARTPRSPKKSNSIVTQQQQQGSPKRPDTPQSLDEEEPPQFKHHIDIATVVPRSASVVGRTPIKIVPDEYDYDERIDEEDSENEGVYREYIHPSYTERNIRTYRENTIASDHSYTLCKSSKQQRIEIPGVQTPSDSEEEEEIDVESLGGDKYIPGVRATDALPTNPSVLDRHQLQRTVASAMNVRTLQQQRPGRPACTSRPRKRPRDRSPPAQQSRYRKRKKLTVDPRRSPTERRAVPLNNSDSEAENLEKRSLHNDMERQRRISLKKLFDELKNEVPSIKDKERAPKVLILREASALCLKLQREEREREQLISYQARLMKRVRNLRMDLAARRPNA